MEAAAAFVDEHGWLITIILGISYAAWKERGRLLGWLNRFFKIAEKGQYAELDFEQQLRQKFLENGKGKDRLIKWAQELYEESIQETRAANRAAYDSQIGAQQTAQQFADVMVQSFEVLDGLSRRLDALTEAIRENSKVLGQAYFVIRRERQRRDDEKVVE